MKNNRVNYFCYFPPLEPIEQFACSEHERLTRDRHVSMFCYACVAHFGCEPKSFPGASCWGLGRSGVALGQSSQKRGLIGPKIRQTTWVICCCFSVFQCICGFFWGSNYSQIANVDFRTYCNTFWNIFATSKNVTKP